MKENRQTEMPRPLIAVMIVMLGIALLPIRWYGYYVLLKFVVPEFATSSIASDEVRINNLQ